VLRLIISAAKDTWQIIFSGVGGQGLVLAGNLLGRAAVEYEGKNAVMTSAYGVETRGTFTKSDVIISKEEIYYPEVERPDIIIALDSIAYQRYQAIGEDETLLVYDSNIASLSGKEGQVGFPISQIASEVGNPAVANVVSLGILIGLCSVVSEASASEAIRSEFQARPRLIETNLRALMEGLRVARETHMNYVHPKE